MNLNILDLELWGSRSLTCAILSMINMQLCLNWLKILKQMPQTISQSMRPTAKAFSPRKSSLLEKSFLRWLNTEFHTSFRTSGSPHKPSQDFSMLAWPFAMLYSFAVYFCMMRVTCSRQLGVIAWRKQIADANKNSIFLNIKQYIS